MLLGKHSNFGILYRNLKDAELQYTYQVPVQYLKQSCGSGSNGSALGEKSARSMRIRIQKVKIAKNAPKNAVNLI